MCGLGLVRELPNHLLTVSVNTGPAAGLSVASHCSSEKVQPPYMALEARRSGSCPLPRLLHTHSAPPHSTTLAVGKGANLSPTSNPFRLLTVQKAPPPAFTWWLPPSSSGLRLYSLPPTGLSCSPLYIGLSCHSPAPRHCLLHSADDSLYRLHPHLCSVLLCSTECRKAGILPTFPPSYS